MTETCCDPTGDAPVIECRDLNIAYDTTPAIKSLNLQVKRASITAIVGPSGSGKSSLLLSLNRLTDQIPRCQVKGQIRIDGEDIHQPETDVVTLRKCVGTLFQRPNPFPLSIWKNLELPLKEHGCQDKQILEEKITRALTDVGLWDEVKDRLKSSALHLSGGQQQRLCLARALVLKPQVLLMDEPCSALDPLSTEVVEDLILKMQGEYTILIVTHNLMQAKRIADQAVLLWSGQDGGHLVEACESEKFFSAPDSDLALAYIRGLKG